MNIHRHTEPVISAPIRYKSAVITYTASCVVEVPRGATHEGLAGWACREERHGVSWGEHDRLRLRLGADIRVEREGWRLGVEIRVEREGWRRWVEIRVEREGWRQWVEIRVEREGWRRWVEIRVKVGGRIGGPG